MINVYQKNTMRVTCAVYFLLVSIPGAMQAMNIEDEFENLLSHFMKKGNSENPEITNVPEIGDRNETKEFLDNSKEGDGIALINKQEENNVENEFDDLISLYMKKENSENSKIAHVPKVGDLNDKNKSLDDSNEGKRIALVNKQEENDIENNEVTLEAFSLILDLLASTKKVPKTTNVSKIEHTGSPKELSLNGYFSLVDAAAKGNFYSVKNFVDRGDDLNQKNHEGKTPLMVASKKGNLYIVKYLVEHGADINKKDNNGNTALIFAAKQGIAKMVKHLVEYGADIDKKDKNGDTALIFAAKQGNAKIVKYLVEQGAEMNKEIDPEFLYPLFIRSSDLFRCSSLSPSTTVLYVAALLNNNDIIKKMVGSRKEFGDAEGKTVLDFLLKDGNAADLLKESILHSVLYVRELRATEICTISTLLSKQKERVAFVEKLIDLILLTNKKN